MSRRAVHHCVVLFALFGLFLHGWAIAPCWGQGPRVRDMRFRLEVVDTDSGELKSLLPPGPVGTVGLIDGVPVLGLESCFDGDSLTIEGIDKDAPTLIRELARQAFLTAAREHLGCRTRDALLGEALPTDVLTEIGRLGIFVALQKSIPQSKSPHSLIGVAVIQEVGDVREIVFAKTYRFEGHHFLALPEFAQQMARDSATEFPKLLHQLKVPSRPRPPAHEKELPAELTESRFVMDDLAQFARIRHLHDWLDKHGPHREAYQELALAYGHLGVLTEHFWCDFSAVCKARALLYALREMDDADSASPTAEDSPASQQPGVAKIRLAYLHAILGRHDASLKLLEGIPAEDDRADGENSPEKLSPTDATLFQLAARIAHADAAGLQDLEESADANLAALASFYRAMLLELTQRKELVYQQVSSAAESHPTCTRLWDSLMIDRDVVYLRVALFNMEQAMSLSLDLNQQPLQELGPGFEQALGDYDSDLSQEDEVTARKQVITLLRDAAEDEEKLAEWTSSVLARLLHERAYVVAVSEVNFLAYSLGLDPSEALELHRELCGDHPLFPAVEIVALQKAHDPQLSKQLAAIGPHWPMPSWRHFQLRSALAAHQRRANNDPYTYRSVRFENNHDTTSSEIILFNQVMGGYGYNLNFMVKRVDLLSPFSEFAVLEKLLAIPLKPDSDFSQIEATAGDSPLVLEMLAKRLGEIQRYDDQLRILQRLNQLAPTEANLILLAKLYEKKEDRENWVRTIQQIIDHPHGTLEGVHQEVELAYWYRDQNQLDLALSHARSAARSGSYRSYACLKNIHVNRGRYAEADQVFEVLARRYSAGALEWYKWCIFHGFGRRDEAESLTVAYFESYGIPAPKEILENIAEYYLLKGEYGKSVEVMAKHDPYRFFNDRSVLMGICLADKVNRITFRNMMLQHLVNLHEKTRATTPDKVTPEMKFAVLLQKSLFEDKPELLTLAAIEEICANEPSVSGDTLFVLAAHFLDKAGKPELAPQFLERAAYSEFVFVPATVYARELLRKQGRKIGPLNEGLAPPAE